MNFYLCIHTVAWMESCEYKPQAPLINYITWFIKRIWRMNGIEPYRDCVTLITRELNIVDRCLIYRTITGNEWFYGKKIDLQDGEINERMVHEMLRVGIIVSEPKSCISDIRNIPFDITNKDAIVWIYNNLDDTYDFIKWATKCLTYNNIHPLEYLVAHGDLDDYDYNQLMRCVVKQDHVKACLLVHAHIQAHASGTKISICRRPNTFAIMRDLGYSFQHKDPKGYLMCIPVDKIPYNEMSNVVTWAMEYPRTKWLDVIHAYICIEDMLAFCEWYYPAGLQWFLEHGVHMNQLNVSIIAVYDFEFLAPLCDDRMRAEMIAFGESDIVRHVAECAGTIREYTWDHVWFIRRASYARIHLMQKMLRKT